ncbi:Patatin [Paraburkholderia piptadeniae]|uniref:Patatin n=1 Tax=Paraburkholderia piptadeniae TaxID=1701573 RepID=A0A1N7SW39_9BURK|nr:patatin-like phospholipase family protein [Paraburkholderia piptadeniae]SIT51661.1 Patatin [Paraburkholderia piptadeniae]
MHSSQRNKLQQPHRIKLPAYDEIGLVLQGGGALGSYQAGVYEGLAEVGVEPTRISGISIGALNTAIIAGNAPAARAEALRGFWDTISQKADFFSQFGARIPAWPALKDAKLRWSSAWSATRTLMEGQQGFFSPRMDASFPSFGKKRPDQVSYYDTSALRETLLKYANFDRINDGNIRVSVGAVNVRTGNLVYFDNSKMRLAPEHFIASGALPPGFPAVEIDGEFYWDGGLVSNTPLTEIIRESQHKDTLVFQIDLWSSRGKLPGDFLDVSERTKDIQYSSRTRAITAFMSQNQRHAQMIKALLEHIPENVRRAHPLLQEAQKTADGSAVNVVHLIYKNKSFEGHYKDYEFSKDTMREHWASGLEDIRRSFGHPEWFDIPSREIGFVTRDVHRYRPEDNEIAGADKKASPPSKRSPEREVSGAK